MSMSSKILQKLLCILTLYIHLFAGLDHDLFYPTTSSNFVIRWAFQELCDFVFDPRTVWPTSTDVWPATFDPKKVRVGDMVFVRDAHHFFKTMHSKIKVPYFIMTHGEYLDTFQEGYFDYLEDSRILGWFTIHPHKKKHERVFPIPLGIVQYHDIYKKREDVHNKFLKYRHTKKEKLLYMNFTDWRNPDRKRIRDYFLEQKFCNNGHQCPFEKYIRETALHKFIVSPPGLGPDCYRIYESLLVGTIPIVQHSYLDYMYEGLPVLFIDNWEQVTEEFLNEAYKEFTSKKYNPERLYMQYWIDYINVTRKRLLDAYRECIYKDGIYEGYEPL